MKNYLYLIIYLFTFFGVQSQNLKQFDYELLGVIVLGEKQLMSYKIEFNFENVILKDYKVTRKKRQINLNLIEGDNLVKIITEDSGKLETNTTKLKIHDFRREYEVVANLEEGNSATINIVKVKVKQNKK